MRGLRLRLLQLTAGVLWIASWHLAHVMAWGRELYVSSPGAVWSYLVQAAANDGELWTHLEITIRATLVAFVIATVAGVTAGLVLSMLPRLAQVLEPYISAANSLPRIALAPIFIIYFGIGIESKIALAVSVVFFVLLVSTQAGVRTADPDIIRMATMLDLNKRQRFVKVLFPLATPSIFAGVRLGIVYSLLGVVTGEIIASRAGVGQLIIQYSGRFRTDSVYGLLLVLGFVAASLNTLSGVVERRLLRNRVST